MKAVSRINVVILGSGSSDGVPSAACLLKGDSACKACRAAAYDKRNVRGQTCALVQVFYEDSTVHNIVIDCGPTFATAAAKYLPELGITKIDALLLTHEHADATAGIPFLRQWKQKKLQDSIDLYTSQLCADELKRQYPYALDSFNQTGQTAMGAGVRLHVIPDNGTFTLFDTLPIHTLTVQHGLRGGKPFPCLGFMFPLNVLYISDMERMPDEVLYRIHSLKGSSPISAFVVDGYSTQYSTTHCTIFAAACITQKIGCDRAYTTQINDGPSHQYLVHLMERFEDQKFLDERSKAEEHNPIQNNCMPIPNEPVWIRPSYDGMSIQVTRDATGTISVQDSEYASPALPPSLALSRSLPTSIGSRS